MEDQTYKERITNVQVIEREMMVGYKDVRLPIKQRLDNGDFLVIFQSVLYDVITKSDLSKPEYKVLFYFVSVAEMDSSITINLDLLVSELKLKKSNISKALNILVKRNIILKKCVENGGRKHGKPNHYELSLSKDRLNYRLMWKGKIKDYKNVKGQDPTINHEPKQLNAPIQRTLFDQPE